MSKYGIIVCREEDSKTGAVTLYRLSAPPGGATFLKLHIKARLTPQRRYFLCAERWREAYEELTQILGKNLVVSGAVLNQFGITEI